MVAYLSRPNFGLQKTREKCHELNLSDCNDLRTLRTCHWRPPCYAVLPENQVCSNASPTRRAGAHPGWDPTQLGRVLSLAICIITINCSRTLVTLPSLPHLQGLSRQLYKAASFHRIMLWISLVQRDSRIFPGDKGYGQPETSVTSLRHLLSTQSGTLPRLPSVSTHCQLAMQRLVCAHSETSFSLHLYWNVQSFAPLKPEAFSTLWKMLLFIECPALFCRIKVSSFLHCS